MAAAIPNGIPATGQILSLLKHEDFSFHMRGWKADAAAFFAPTPERDTVLEERSRWLRGTPGLYCGALESANDSLDEMAAHARQWAGNSSSFSSSSWPSETEPEARCLALGCGLEPDFILLTEAGYTVFRAVAGAVCFPSSWDFRRTLGKRVAEIHGVVPGLNDAIGDRIDALLRKLHAGESWSRMNWGISLSPERNQHPSRDLPRLSAATVVAGAWLRVELQVLHKLPRSGAILFGIRPVSIALAEVAASPGAAAALKRQLDTMPAAMRDYKGIGGNVHLLDRWLM